MQQIVAQGRQDGGQQDDPVWEYVQALESTDPSLLNQVMQKYGYNDEAMTAMSALHKIFDPAISFVDQLMRLRATGHIGA